MSERTVQEMLHEYLDTLGFAAMSNDVLDETDQARLRRYARVILRELEKEQTPGRMEVRSGFALLGLV